ncbi:MAG: bifunctional oligoribonuclease/PAP phosphatase NrnA, partial [Aliifodinibius sp.]|nr:bifunctional oligoribonuclease/PAP phosphatase NrnA [Fodinibius sp.]NIW80950.1 bifunctional oligoribonuclease/PAP phosphatase NrnA [Calditrichia bacterium]
YETETEVVYSLRSRGDFDVSALAERFGGGGHKNAAGFRVKRSKQ